MSLALKLPIRYSATNGFVTLDTFSQTIRQNFKMLILTNPGERVMVPRYGVGVQRFLFENYGSGMEGKLKSKIIEQSSFYMPIVEVNNILIDSSRADMNMIDLKIYYSIPDIGVQDLLEFTI